MNASSIYLSQEPVKIHSTATIFKWGKNLSDNSWSGKQSIRKKIWINVNTTLLHCAQFLSKQSQIYSPVYFLTDHGNINIELGTCHWSAQWTFGNREEIILTFLNFSQVSDFTFFLWSPKTIYCLRAAQLNRKSIG